MKKIAIFTTHPIQYQAPFFRALTRVSDLEIKVFFSYEPDATRQGTGFGRAFTWDVPLRDGYANEVLGEIALPASLPRFARAFATGLGTALELFKPDAAMILGWQEFSLIQALLACRRRGTPTILRGESNALRTRHWIMNTIHQRYFGLFDAYLAIGRANAELYLKRGVSPERIATAGYFVDNDRFRSAADSLREERNSLRALWNIPRDACCFAFVGKLVPKKRVMDFLRAIDTAAAKGERVHALVVGSGEQMEQALSYVNQRSLPVTFAGFMNQSVIAQAYVAADTLVLPSDFGETWGLVVNEAMATGLPAIVSDRIGSANDLVLDGKTGFVIPFGDTLRLAAAMKALLEDPALRTTLGSAAQSRVFSEFSIEKAVEGLRMAVAIALREF